MIPVYRLDNATSHPCGFQHPQQPMLGFEVALGVAEDKLVPSGLERAFDPNQHLNVERMAQMWNDVADKALAANDLRTLRDKGAFAWHAHDQTGLDCST